MHIGIDGYEANTKQRVGIGQYAFQLLTTLHQIDTKNSYTLFLSNIPSSDMPREHSRWRYIVGKPQSFWTVRQLPGLIKAQKSLDIFFSPTHYIPWFVKVPRIAAIMDLSYLHFPQMFRKKDLLQLKYMGRYTMQNAQRIVTISEFSKKEISDAYNYPAHNITVTYPGINELFLDEPAWVSEKELYKKYAIDKPFILFVGTLQPRKNLARLIKAYNTLTEDVLLILVGKKGWLFEPIFDEIQKSPKKNNIRILDYVPAEELPTLYREALCFVLPSLYEGFGIPVLEALQCGCLLVVSKTSSLPEVGGNAAIYVDPLEVSDIARGISEAVQLKPEARRKRIQEGYKQAKKFSWKVCAEKTVAIFDSLQS